MENLLGKVKNNWWVWVAGAGLGLGVGWFFTGLNHLLTGILVSEYVKLTLVLLHTILGCIFIYYIKEKRSYHYVLGALGITVGALVIAPLPSLLIATYKILPLLSDLSLVYNENTIKNFSDILTSLLPLFFISFTTIIFLLIGKAITEIARKVRE